MWKKWSVLLTLSYGISTLPAPALELSQKDLDEKRDIFIRAEHALKKQDYANYQQLAQKITTYPLYPYLIYYELKQNIQNKALDSKLFDKVQQFQSSFPDFPYHFAVDELLLSRLAKNQNWAQFVKYYKPQNNTALTCYYHLAQYNLTKNTEHFDSAKNLWLVGHSQPLSCDKLFIAWEKSGHLKEDLIWERFALCLHENNHSLGKGLIKLLSGNEKKAAQFWLKASKKPELINASEFLKSDIPESLKAQISTDCLHRLAKKNALSALNWWHKNQQAFSFNETQKNLIERDIGVYLCHQRHPFAKGWLASLKDSVLDHTALEWRIRLSLLEKDWPQVLSLIENLPKSLKEDPCWQYWKARALSSTGKNTQAQELYQQLASNRNYYGFISSLHLKQPISIQSKPVPITSDIIDNVEKIPAIQRFKELNLLQRHAVARVEWFKALDKMNEKEIIACAKIAQKMNYPDLAIFTMLRADFKDDIPLRFPLAHQQEILKNAQKHNIDPAWIFGVARQESAFFNEAISKKSARGLLQLLPSTAKTLAKDHDIKYDGEFCLHKPDINLKLGAAYLNNLKAQMYNHIVLATASYNAGPTRTLKWLPKQPLDADIWIDTLPYKETREYIKNVLTFTSIYRVQLGYPAALELIMKTIPSNP